jgi:hypothetical protein
MHIDREDMLELTRRMTIARNCFNRVAGAYMDEEGFIDGSFNTHRGCCRVKSKYLVILFCAHIVVTSATNQAY